MRNQAACPLPMGVQAAWPDGFRINSENEVHVRGNSNVQIAWVVTDERAIIEENVGPGVELSEPGGQQAGDFRYLSILMHVVRRRLLGIRIEFQAGVVNLPTSAVRWTRETGQVAKRESCS